MAVVWAKQAGGWTTASIWAFWNEVTQQIENYGQEPQEGDTVYLNGYSISTGNINIGNGIIRNDFNPYTNRQGGGLSGYTQNITANLHFTNNGSAYSSSTHNCTIIGDVYVENCYMFSMGNGGGTTVNITGNVTSVNNGQVFQTSGNATVFGRLTINGNVTSNGLLVGYYSTNYGNSYLTINGNVTASGDLANKAIPISINGNLTANADMVNMGALSVGGNLIINNATISPASLTIGGHISYTGTSIYKGLQTATITISNPSAFYWENTLEQPVDYPQESDVKLGVRYDFGRKVGTMTADYPQEAVVLKDVEYANGSMVGTLEVVQLQADYPSEDDVRFDVPFDFGNKQGKCHVPIPEDVRDGVPVDVNEVGTLIPSSGGDRLRIADFGYYTNAQSDTYIVDLTEQDKPKFAVAEERVLIEMFPDLDLNNIPDKYFDDLFVKYLKYRLIVEYYRTAGINSTFTPSEPTTEIVNYQNVRNEVWLNSANIYLKAWGKKYPESITKPQRILL